MYYQKYGDGWMNYDTKYCDSYNNYIDFEFIKKLKLYIHDELEASKYYAILANKAPTKRAKDILMEFSRDECMHAENFMNVYYMLTGTIYRPPAIEKVDVPEYEEALKDRIIAETSDYKEYGEQYLKLKNPCLKDLFFMIRTDEGKHAMRIPLLMEEEEK